MSKHIAAVADTDYFDAWLDGLVRAWRTFYTSVGVDILLALGAGLLLLMNTSGADLLSPAFWLAVLLLFIRSALTGVATFWLRMKLPPKI